MTKQQNRERGGWLSAWLIIIILHGALMTFLVLDSLKQEYAPNRPFIIATLLIISIADVVAALAIWKWKKWGLYLYAAAIVVGIFIHLIITGSLLVVFYDVIPLAILGYLLNTHNKWRYFD